MLSNSEKMLKRHSNSAFEQGMMLGFPELIQHWGSKTLCKFTLKNDSRYGIHEKRNLMSQ